MDLPDLPIPFTTREATSAGLPPHLLLDALRRDQVAQVGHGLYLPNRPAVVAERWQVTVARHLQSVRVALRRHPGHVVSHSSAAILQGLQLSISADSPVELTCLRREPRSRREPGIVLHHCDDNDVPVTEVDGIPVTTVSRTVADTLRSRTLAHGTAMLDAALRAQVLSKDELLDVLDGQRRWRGRPRALAAVTLSDPRRETWLESFSFVRLHELAIPLPLAQVTILTPDHDFAGRVDGLLPEHGVFLESDGSGKYFIDARPEETVGDTALRKLDQERARHRRLESLGLRGVRWTAAEIGGRADVVAARIMRAVRQPRQPICAYARWGDQQRRIPFELSTPSVNMETLTVRRRRRRLSA